MPKYILVTNARIVGREQLLERVLVPLRHPGHTAGAQPLCVFVVVRYGRTARLLMACRSTQVLAPCCGARSLLGVLPILHRHHDSIKRNGQRDCLLGHHLLPPQRRLELLPLLLPACTEQLGQAIQAAFRGCHVPQQGKKLLPFLWCQVGHHPRRLLGCQGGPPSLDHLRPQLQRAEGVLLLPPCVQGTFYPDRPSSKVLQSRHGALISRQRLTDLRSLHGGNPPDSWLFLQQLYSRVVLPHQLSPVTLCHRRAPRRPKNLMFSCKYEIYTLSNREQVLLQILPSRRKEQLPEPSYEQDE